MPLKSWALNMAACIQYSYSLPAHCDCCPTFNAISDLDHACNRGKHITGACDIIEDHYGILFTTYRKIVGYKAFYHGSLTTTGLPLWRIYRLIPKIWQIVKAFDYNYFGLAIWRIFGNFLKHLASKVLVWRNMLTHHFL